MFLVFNDAPTYNIDLTESQVFTVGSITVSAIKAVTVGFCAVALVGLWFTLARTSVGRKMRAVEANPVLAATYGIRVKWIFVLVFALGSAIPGVLGILQASTYAASPTMGEATIIYAFVVAFLGRNRGPLVMGLIGIGLGVAEALIGQWFGLIFRNLVVFLVLFAFIALRPYLGRRTVRTARRRRPVPVPA